MDRDAREIMHEQVVEEDQEVRIMVDAIPDPDPEEDETNGGA